MPRITNMIGCYAVHFRKSEALAAGVSPAIARRGRIEITPDGGIGYYSPMFDGLAADGSDVPWNRDHEVALDNFFEHLMSLLEEAIPRRASWKPLRMSLAYQFQLERCAEIKTKAITH